MIYRFLYVLSRPICIYYGVSIIIGQNSYGYHKYCDRTERLEPKPFLDGSSRVPQWNKHDFSDWDGPVVVVVVVGCVGRLVLFVQK